MLAIIPPKLSVVVPSYGSRSLPRVLESLLELGAEEVIVVDSSPEPPKINDKRVRLISVADRALPGRARNIGARAARGEYLLFVDADVLFTPKSFEFLEAFLREPSDAPICGTYDLDYEGDSAFSRMHNLILRHRFGGVGQGQQRGWSSSSHFIIRRELFQEVGGFHEQLRTHEDNEFFLRCEHLGHPVVVHSAFTAIHLKAYDALGTLKDYGLKVYSGVRARHRHPAVFGLSSAQVGSLMGLNWLAGALLPWFLLAGLSSLLPWTVAGPIIAALFVSPVSLWPNVLRPLPLGWKLKTLLLWPALGTTIASAYVLALVSAGMRRLKKALIGAWDFFVALWRITFKTGMPVQIINFVTAVCNLRCTHCFYKEALDSPNPGELPLDLLDKTTSEVGPLLWYAFGGGEIYLRKDLPELVRVIQKNCRPKVMSVPSNGWYSDKTYESTLRILQEMEWGDFVLMISIDGPREVHDAVRGEGSFDRAKATFRRLRKLQDLYPNFNLTITTTVQPDNAQHFPAFVDELVRDFNPRGISINLFRYHALEHPPIPEAVLEAYRLAVLRYEEHLNSGAVPHYSFFGSRVVKVKDLLQKELIYRVAKTNEFVTPCTSGTLSYVIWEDGRVGPCEVLSDDIGRIGEGASFRELIKAKQAKTLRKWVDETQCRCTYECAQGNNAMFSRPMIKHLARGVVGKRRLEL